MNALIIDDEEPAIKILQNFAAKVPFLNIDLATTNALEGIQFLSSNKVDLILLDIEMPDISGIEFVKSLNHKPLIIFTTAYEEYALKGYELDITDYLLKPIRFERFLKAVNKANALCTSSSAQPELDHVYVKSEYQTIKILFKDILYIEGLKDYVKIHTTEKTIITRLNVKGIHAKLPSNKFVRVHRSFIVSLTKINAFQKQQIRIGNTEIPIGDAYSSEFQKYL